MSVCSDKPGTHRSEIGASAWLSAAWLSLSCCAWSKIHHTNQSVRIQSTLRRLMWTLRAGDDQGSRGTECTWEPGRDE